MENRWAFVLALATLTLAAQVAALAVQQGDEKQPTFDTLKAQRELESGGVGEGISESLVRAFEMATTHLATRQEMTLAIAELEADAANARANTTRWIALAFIGSTGITIGGVTFVVNNLIKRLEASMQVMSSKLDTDHQA